MIPNELTSALFGIALVLAGIGLAVAGILERSPWLVIGGGVAAVFGARVLRELVRDAEGNEPRRRNWR